MLNWIHIKIWNIKAEPIKISCHVHQVNEKHTLVEFICLLGDRTHSDRHKYFLANIHLSLALLLFSWVIYWNVLMMVQYYRSWDVSQNMSLFFFYLLSWEKNYRFYLRNWTKKFAIGNKTKTRKISFANFSVQQTMHNISFKTWNNLCFLN